MLLSTDGSIVMTIRDAALRLFLPPNLVERNTNNDKPSLNCLLVGRDRLLEACHEAKIYAIGRTVTNEK